ncbi:MAG: phosphoribosyltransferase [Actinomycetota bacterium]|nr:MAG: phosphoribosyltransferase [Actinomycetota bacterium]
MFRDRRDAGERLGEALRDRVDPPAIVLGIARGGVVVAAPVAEALGAPLDVVVPRKLGAPHNPELGIGAIAPGVVVLDEDLVRRLGVDEAYVRAETARQQREIERRLAAYRGDRPPPELAGKTAVIVDDGVATGGTAIAASRWARREGAERVVIAAPVGPAGIERRLAPEADDVVVLFTPRTFLAVGEWYERFEQTGDDEVRALLATETA